MPDLQTASEVAELFRLFTTDPQSVPAAWQTYFAHLTPAARGYLEGLPPHTLRQALEAEHKTPTPPESSTPPPGSTPPPESSPQAARDASSALMLIRAYRARGHLKASLDPLGLSGPRGYPELDPETHGFKAEDFQRPIYLGGVLGLDYASLDEIMPLLKSSYCGSVGVEYTHIQDPERKAWVQKHIERPAPELINHEQRMQILTQLIAAEEFERFLSRKFAGTKRFGLDGGESTIPAMEAIITQAADFGVEDLIIGMAHRGRLNVIANIMRKPLPAIFREFMKSADDAQARPVGAGDVKYHLGTSCDRVVNGRPLHLSLTANPSHLEAVNPVVLGKTRAKQEQRGDTERRRVVPLLLHGDAAFAGQGLVGEGLDLSELRGYRVGGTLHLVINNQIGFTTNPVNSRSGPYCSDVAKSAQCPIFHVNCDDPDAVVRTAKLAMAFRHRFAADVVIDLFCYRRFGHNEIDDPAFTQPLMYKKIAALETTRGLYAQRLIAEKVITSAESDARAQSYRSTLEEGLEAAKNYRENDLDWLGGAWSGLAPVRGYDARKGSTALTVEQLHTVSKALTRVPEGFNLHKKIDRFLKARGQALTKGEGIDWATAESLALGALSLEGTPVRFSGQDSRRGTFSHRHAHVIDQDNEASWVPLANIHPDQAHIEIIDSPLSELAVLGFEYGYALANPKALVLWEAQFGDFANGAQVVIDQFISSGEAKWLRMCGLVLLLPHGYEGQGPEHSSARLERHLQLCAEDNIQVVNCTTPANFFHCLRRQIHRTFRKPLIVMTPKSLLRHPACVSQLADFGPGTSFHRLLTDQDLPHVPRQVQQVVLCSGKVYYDLIAARRARKDEQVAIIRLEQLYPFPEDRLGETLRPYRHCPLVWCQEEPRNMGAWPFVSTFIEEIASDIGFAKPRPRYAGRHTAASPATGDPKQHAQEQARLCEEALTRDRAPLSRIAARKALSAILPPV